MNEDQQLPLQLRQLIERNQQLEQFAAMRGRMFVGILSEGLQAMLAAARAGDPGAQADLAILRDLLEQIGRSGSEAAAKIAVVRKTPN